MVLSGGKDTRIPHALKLFEEGYAPEILLTDEKKRNIRFSHLFPTNEMIAQAMIEELEMSASVSTIQSQKGGATSTFDEAYDLLKLSEKKTVAVATFTVLKILRCLGIGYVQNVGEGSDGQGPSCSTDVHEVMGDFHKS